MTPDPMGSALMALRAIAEFPITVASSNMDATNMRTIARNALAATPSRASEAGKPVAGWKLVPAEPTQKMLKAGHWADDGAMMPTALYKAMLDAAPAPSEAVKGVSTAEPVNEESTVVDLWAEIWRLREAIKGPDGYASWQDAATAERIRRVQAEQALAAHPKPAAPATADEAVSDAEIGQFLSDVMTAAGLVTHGKQSRSLGERLGDGCMRVRSALFLRSGASALPAEGGAA